MPALSTRRARHRNALQHLPRPDGQVRDAPERVLVKSEPARSVLAPEETRAHLDKLAVEGRQRAVLVGEDVDLRHRSRVGAAVTDNVRAIVPGITSDRSRRDVARRVHRDRSRRGIAERGETVEYRARDRIAQIAALAVARDEHAELASGKQRDERREARDVAAVLDAPFVVRPLDLLPSEAVPREQRVHRDLLALHLASHPLAQDGAASGELRDHEARHVLRRAVDRRRRRRVIPLPWRAHDAVSLDVVGRRRLGAHCVRNRDRRPRHAERPPDAVHEISLERKPRDILDDDAGERHPVRRVGRRRARRRVLHKPRAEIVAQRLDARRSVGHRAWTNLIQCRRMRQQVPNGRRPPIS